MHPDRIFREEDLFPKRFTGWEERSFGYLFCNPENPSSYDANHALLLRDRTPDPATALGEILRYYQEHGVHPTIYQAAGDEGYFREISNALTSLGFDWWPEEQRYMLLQEPCSLPSSPGITVSKVSYWEDSIATGVFELAGEPWETDVARRTVCSSGAVVYAARKSGYPIGIIYGHISQNIARVDYMLVPEIHRRRGIGRALVRAFVNDPAIRSAEVCYLWTDNPIAERIYAAAGFRYAFTLEAARASWRAPASP